MYRFDIVIITLLSFANATFFQNKAENECPRTKLPDLYCEHDETTSGNKKLTWRRTQVGVTMFSEEFCVNTDGRIIGRDCDNTTYAAVWKEVRENCSEHFETSDKTDQLHKIFLDYVVDGYMNYSKLMLICDDIHKFTYVDQYLLSRLFYTMTSQADLTKLLQNYFSILNNVMELDLNDEEQTFKMFKSYNYTLAGINVFFKRIANELQNLTSIHTKHFVFEISNPFSENISGFGLYKTSSDSFLNYTVKKMYTNESHDIIDTENLEVAGYLSKEVLDHIRDYKTKEEREKMKIFIAAFDRNKLFDLGNDLSVVSRIIAVSITNFCSQGHIPLFNVFLKSDTNASGEWFVIQNKDMYNDDFTECSYTPITYMFLYDDMENSEVDNLCNVSKRFPFIKINVYNSLFGNAPTNKYQLVVSNIVSLPAIKDCSFSDQKTFIGLVEYNDRMSKLDILSSLSISIQRNTAQFQTVIEAVYKRHDFVLRTIMMFGCVLSLIGVIGFLLTIFMIKNWYQKRWFSLQLMTTMALETILFLVTGEKISYVAYIVLYYFILSQFSWMMLIGYNQYKKFVRVFKGDEISIVKSLIIGWLLPLIVIIIPVCIYSECFYCQPCIENKVVTIYFVILPTSLIILGNVVIYILVMWNISKSKCQDFGINISGRQTKLALLLPFLLGFTWGFLFALVSPWSTFALIGSYLFHIVAPTQTFVLFVFIVLMDADTRHKWSEIISSYKKNKVHPIKSTINKSISKNDTNVDVFTIFK